MNKDELILWENIKDFSIDDPESEFSFTDRLARENSWSHEFSIRSILEYKRFIFLICISEHPLTPSDQVDQVWHLHLIYTQSYWEDFCGKVLKRKIQHGPTKGGISEKDKFNNYYEQTKELYKRKFDKEPPNDIWPDSSIRFSEINFTRINRHRNWVIPKPTFIKKWKS